MGSTTPSNIYFADENTNVSIEGITAAMAQSVETALTGASVPYRFMDEIIYTSNGTFIKANYPGLRMIELELVGGGGGGAGANNSSGGGGGAGAYVRHRITDIASMPSSIPVTIGQGGAGGTAGGNGASGTSTSFGSLAVAQNGTGGNTNGLPGQGSISSSVGMFRVPGMDGGAGSAALSDNASGHGGSSYFGGGPRGIRVGASSGGISADPAAYGCGGGGGRTASTTTGGAGANGLVIVRLFG